MSNSSAYVPTLSTIIQYLSSIINLTSLIIGTIGGFCNLIVFTDPRLGRNACVFYLLCANIFQLFSIIFAVPIRMAWDNFGTNLERQSIIFCKIRYYLVSTLPELAVYYLLLSILDRCLATCDDARLRAWSQLKVAHRLSAGLFIVGFVSNVHVLVLFTIYNDNCQPIPNLTYNFFLAVYSLVVIILLPHTLMLILCVMTFVNMKRTKRRVVESSHSQSQNKKQRRRFETHIIMVIILQVVVSSILQLLRIGSYLYVTITSGNLNKTMEERAVEGFVLQFGIALYYFSFAISFYVSTLPSKYFRDIFWKRITGFRRSCCGQS